jgi:hypothetical protein
MYRDNCTYIVCKRTCAYVLVYMCTCASIVLRMCTHVYSNTTQQLYRNHQHSQVHYTEVLCVGCVVFSPCGLICSRRRRPFVQLAFQIEIAQLLVTNLALVFTHNRFSSLLVRLIFYARMVIHKNASLRSLSSLSLIFF